MNLAPFEYVLTLAELKNFSRAADALYISQPSLSKYITNLEKELGVKLIDRTTSHFEITYAGEIFVDAARSIVDLRDKLISQLEDIKDLKKGRVVVGMPRHRGTLFLPNMLPVFYERYPGIEVDIVEGSSAELEDATVQGKTDFSILDLPVFSDQLIHVPLANEKILVTLPPNHPLKKRITGFPQDLANLPLIHLSELRDDYFILRKKGNRLRQIANALFIQASFKPKVRLESSSMQTIQNLVAAGVGVSFVIDSGIVNPSATLLFALDMPQTSLQLVAVYRKEKKLSKAANAFIEVAKEILNKSNF
jgi:DNA-binding transcriptional LysR family regulator